MSGVRGTRLRVSVQLDWTDANHWDKSRERPCKLCHGLTHERSNGGEPIHHVCFERRLELQIIAAGHQILGPRKRIGSVSASRGADKAGRGRAGRRLVGTPVGRY